MTEGLTISILDALLLASGGIFFLGWFAVALVSWAEGENTAGRRALTAALLLPLPLLLTALLRFSGRVALSWVLLLAPWTSALVAVLPIRLRPAPRDGQPSQRHDERDTIFSRADLEPDTERFREYYERRPENLEADERFRRQPGLLSPDSRHADSLSFAAVEAGFFAEEHLRFITDGPVCERRIELDPAAISRYIRGLALYLGAHSVGFTRLKPEHLYTVGGRREWYGKPVENDHPHAIALSVEMDYRMNRQGPGAGTVMETAKKYLRAAEIAVQLAAFIRRLGYSARAHISSRYQVICPLVARDAGLGEIGRMGLLMTPRLGPRVRLSAVTTDLPLTTAERRFDGSVIAFCESCEKCARICPSQSIPRGPRSEEGGALRWKIDAESCYTFWCQAGSDCGRCMAVCPYSHPDNPLHNLVRFLVRHSGLFRRLAPAFDDLLYGRRPRPMQPHAWQRHGSHQHRLPLVGSRKPASVERSGEMTGQAFDREDLDGPS